MNLILGQGIAGSILAIRLIQRGEQVLIVDDGHATSSSMVAAGLWNPIVFRRINKSWMADRFCHELEKFYPEVEGLLNAKFYHTNSVWRMHSSALEADIWKEKMSDQEYSAYLHDKREYNRDFPLVNNTPFGSGLVKHAGHVDLPEFLSAARRFFVRKAIYYNTAIHLQKIVGVFNEFEFKGIKPTRIIDCRGAKSADDSVFSWLPFGLTKGELLTIRCNNLPLDEIFNAGFFLCPLGDDLFRLGATFNWSDKDDLPTDAGRSELIQKLNKWIKVDFEVVNHKAGIRPTVQDRRPLIGKHPEIPNMYIFNGLGTKGVMLAPWLSNHFCDHLLYGNELLPEINIDRFAHLIRQKNPLINFPHS